MVGRGRYKPLKKRGAKGGKARDWTKAEDRRLVRLWKQSLTTQEITDKFSGTRTFSAIKNRLCLVRGRGKIR